MYIFISVVYFLVLFQSGHEIVKVNSDGKPVKTEKILDSVNKEIANNSNISAREKKELQEKVVKYGAFNKDTDSKKEYKTTHYGLVTTNGDTSFKQYNDNQQKLPSGKRDGFF